MILSDEKIQEFQAIYKKVFGEDLSKAEAYNSAIRLLEHMKVVYRPVTKAEAEKMLQLRK